MTEYCDFGLPDLVYIFFSRSPRATEGIVYIFFLHMYIFLRI